MNSKSTTLDKRQMIKQLARQADITEHQAQTYLEILAGLFAESLAKGEKISYRGLFSLELIEIELDPQKIKLLGGGKLPQKTFRLVGHSSQALKAAAAHYRSKKPAR